MTGALAVLAPGLHTTIQDLGRVGHQDIGMPVAGALDPVALRLANALAGNPPGAAALEMLHQGPTLRVEAETVRVAAAFAGIELFGEGTRIPAWRTVTLSRGESFRMVLHPDSACGYLAIEGGIAAPSFLGSVSTFVRGGIGGFEGRPLRKGDAVGLAREEASEREAEWRLPSPPQSGAQEPVRVVLGPQDDLFTDEAIATFLAATWRISKNADRMGMRLEGPALAHRAGYDIVSDGIVTGAVQVPGSRQPILLLADHQTTGGYPKIATVASADLPLVGRRRSGDALRFRTVGVDEAEEARRQAEDDLVRLVESIEPFSGIAGLDLASLYEGNLISGVVSGFE